MEVSGRSSYYRSPGYASVATLVRGTRFSSKGFRFTPETPPEHPRNARTLRVEYAERGNESSILFLFSLFCEYIHLEYVRIHDMHRDNQVEYVIHILVVAPQEYVNIDSTRNARTLYVHTRTGLTS